MPGRQRGTKTGKRKDTAGNYATVRGKQQMREEDQNSGERKAAFLFGGACKSKTWREK